MRITPRPTRFELGAVRTPTGGSQIVVRMVAGDEELVGTPSDDELRFLRRSIGELLNQPPGARLAAFPTNETDDGPRLRPRLRRLSTPS